MAEDNLAQEIEQLEQKRDALKESLRSANKRIYQWVVAALAAGSCACCTGAERSSNVMFAVVVLLIIVLSGTIDVQKMIWKKRTKLTS